MITTLFNHSSNQRKVRAADSTQAREVRLSKGKRVQLGLHVYGQSNTSSPPKQAGNVEAKPKQSRAEISSSVPFIVANLKDLIAENKSAI